MQIDYLSYNNVFTQLHPIIKFLFFLTSLLAVFFSKPLTLIVIFTVNILFLILFLRIRPFELLRLLLPFVGFGLLVLIILALSIDFTNVNIFSIRLVFSEEGFYKMSFYFLRALACVSCMLILSLTTPFLGIIHILRLFKIPSALIDLMIVAYFYVFVLLKKAREIYISQVSRLGYGDLRGSYRDLAQLVRSEYTLSLDSIKWLYISANSRNFTGQFRFLPGKYTLNLGQIVLFFCLGLFYLLASLLD